MLEVEVDAPKELFSRLERREVALDEIIAGEGITTGNFIVVIDGSR